LHFILSFYQSKSLTLLQNNFIYIVATRLQQLTTDRGFNGTLHQNYISFIHWEADFVL